MDKRIPTLLGISLVAFSVILMSFFIRDRTIFKSSAITTEDPQNITITNTSDTSFNISYTTEESITGTISFGKDINLGFTEIEDLDREKGTISPRIIHSTTLKNLTSNTKYYYVINSGQTTFLNNNAPFEVTTGPSISPSTTQTSISGRVILPNASIPTTTIAYLTILGAQTLSTLVNNDGSFIFQLDSLRSDDLSTPFSLDKDPNIKITFVNDFFISRVLSSYSKTNPLPTISLPNDFDFTLDNSFPTATASGGIGGFREVLPSPALLKNAATHTPVILTPEKGETFSDPQPEFRGKSLPNEKVNITIHSSHAITAEITADSNGNWVFVPGESLTPGSHTFTIQTKDAFGAIKTITQSFIVYAETDPTPTPKSLESISVTITPTATPTPTPTPDTVLINQIPPTGDPNILFFGILAFAITIVGVILFLLTASRKFL
ncbi:MAG: fibronectin type III domain-containing protein [Candidatus Levybacteria bacterium]|nr:fibronectin type III domain-containing protein [Candidatus Levybacteria bacterium]